MNIGTGTIRHATRAIAPRGTAGKVALGGGVVVVGGAGVVTVLLPGKTGAQPSGTRDAREGARLTVAQFNVKNLFDTTDDPRRSDEVPTEAELRLKAEKLERAVLDGMNGPDVVGLQEVENEGALHALLERPRMRAAGYRGVISEGVDPRGIDNALIYRSSRVEVTHVEQKQGESRGPTGRRSTMFTRPPLLVRMKVGGGDNAPEATVVVNHFTSQLQGPRGVKKRREQAAFVKELAASENRDSPARTVIVMGDLNMSPQAPEYAALEGGPADLYNVSERLPAHERFSYRRGSQRTLLDHVLVEQDAKKRVVSASIPHFDTLAARGSASLASTHEGTSDHDPVLAEIRLEPAS